MSRGVSDRIASGAAAARELARPFADLVWPPACPLCMRRLAAGEQAVCDPCRSRLATPFEWRCHRCGATGVGPAPRRSGPCDFCPDPESGIDGVLHCSLYDDTVARTVHLFKYHRRLEVGELMSRLMIARLAEPVALLEGRVNCIAPVPLHWSRRMWRGFNQSGLLASELAGACELPFENLLRRRKHTKMQAHLPRAKRAENVRGAFAARRGEMPDGVLLIDDVVTTGSTVIECARTLRGAGVRRVWVACFARG